VPDAILCSTAKRARQTIKKLLLTCPFEGEISYKRSLYHGSTDEFIEELRNMNEEFETVMIVGHNPGMEYSIEDLCGVDEVMPTAAIAYIQLNTRNWNEINLDPSGELIGLWRPKEI
jgi:phosphohistidine phosphatase